MPFRWTSPWSTGITSTSSPGATPARAAAATCSRSSTADSPGSSCGPPTAPATAAPLCATSATRCSPAIRSRCSPPARQGTPASAATASAPTSARTCPATRTCGSPRRSLRTRSGPPSTVASTAPGAVWSPSWSASPRGRTAWFECLATAGNMVDRASGRLHKPGGCAPGELPKRPKGSDCKSDCTAFGGSNPSLATTGTTRRTAEESAVLRRSGRRGIRESDSADSGCHLP
ncbi:exported hypothetical protein [uncultured Microbacterium sp.]|uniref:Uncharacterized protein n=1 Tax=uncultured Microbacterium sp. TaxID=191216 RepID=A0A1Y5NYS8_9MICO|nr:exported hypothetical protein [uncultured Microbacterium sp.]